MQSLHDLGSCQPDVQPGAPGWAEHRLPRCRPHSVCLAHPRALSRTTHPFPRSTRARPIFFMIQLSHPYMTSGKTIALIKWTFVGKVMSLLFNTLARSIIAFLPRSKHLLISWMHSPSAVILVLKKIKCHCFHFFFISLL